MFLKIYKQRVKFLYKNYFKKLKKFYKKLSFLKKWSILKNTIPNQLYFHKITIHIKPNNIFCTLANIYKKRVLSHYNTGMFFIKTTKKRLKQNLVKVLFFFFKKIYKRLKKTVILNLIVPKNLKKKLFKQISSMFLTRQKHILINVQSKKCFNGCRPPKKQRKKHKYNVLFKR
jgi:hypothetical protein